MRQPHIQLEDDLNIRYAILPGDPGRVERIGAFMEGTEYLGFSREYKSLRGRYRGVDILVMSTGMGGTSTAIGIEELRRIGVTHILRVGSCGALQSDIACGDLLIASGAVRDDGVSRAYVPESYPAAADAELLFDCMEAVKTLGFPHHVGIIRSHESFYLDNIMEINESWSARGVLGSDQETAAVLTVGRLRGMKAMSILNAVNAWKQNVAEGVGSYAGGANAAAEGERREILTALEAIVLNHQRMEKK